MRSLVLILLIFLIACKKENNYVYKLPEKNGDEWGTSSLQDSHIDTLLITQLVSKIQSNDFKNIDALLIIKDGKLVLDEYFNGYNKDKRHKLWSCTKSFSSALVGIAIEQGNIKSEKDLIIDYLGNYSNQANENIKAISIEDVLKMGTGIAWEGDLTESGRKLPYAKDMVAYTLELPQEFEPGTKFQYSSANSMLLAPIIYKATGKHAHDFARATLFKELGIENFEWNKQAEFWTKTAGNEIPAKKPNIEYELDYAELTNTATGLWMVPRDMGKLGQLYLNKGKWKGIQVISSSWVEKSTTEQIQNSNYGLHWKLMQIGNYEMFYASGFGLQQIIVFPKLEMVVVFTQNWYHDQPKGERQMMGILKEYILKGIKNA
jgi:CubicO group peptidase (beta-lactamase class C family)